MQTIRRKLNSESGASIVIALVFFLLCLTVGAIVLTAATANAGRVSRIQKEQQAYFAVRSAAALLRDELEGETFTAKWDKWDSGSAPDDASNYPAYLTAEYRPVLAADATLRELRQTVQEQVKVFFQMQCAGKPLPDKTSFTDFTISADGNIPAVTVQWWIDGAYGLHFSLDTVETSYHYPMSLVVSASANYRTQPRKASWEESYTEGEGEDAVTVLVEHTAAYTRHLLDVTWQTGVITKGAGG